MRVGLLPAQIARNMEKRTIIDDVVEMVYRGDHIFRFYFLPKADVGVEVAKKMVIMADEWRHDQTTANLVDVRKMSFINSEARKYLAAQARPHLVAIGIVMSSKFQGALANMYLKFSKPQTPTRFFETEQEAEVWLKEMLSKRDPTLKFQNA